MQAQIANRKIANVWEYLTKPEQKEYLDTLTDTEKRDLSLLLRRPA